MKAYLFRENELGPERAPKTFLLIFFSKRNEQPLAARTYWLSTNYHHHHGDS
ncbi:hypothetical protein [Thiolapillus sp.]|uniref:hypothetical protein n=1 Tax=Thiolapillus sp. TaxID=2017437 RepID=UPI003AF6EEAF